MAARRRRRDRDVLASSRCAGAARRSTNGELSMMDSTTHIWQAYHTKLRAFISRRANNSDVADDILQDVFLKTHTRLGDLREETRLQSWLYQIARNAITDYYRAPKMQVADAIDLPDESHDAGQRARRELAECLRPMIDSLPP